MVVLGGERFLMSEVLRFRVWGVLPGRTAPGSTQKNPHLIPIRFPPGTVTSNRHVQG